LTAKARAVFRAIRRLWPGGRWISGTHASRARRSARGRVVALHRI